MGSVDVQKNFNEIPMLGVAFEQLTGNPSPTREGRIWTRTDLHVFQVWLNGVIKTLATTDDPRFTDGRPPSGAAGGDLTNNYPNPLIGNNKVLLTHLATALIEAGVSSGTAATTAAALRRLGFAVGDSMAGTTDLSTISTNNLTTSYIDMNGQKVSFMAAGVGPSDAVNLQQLQNAIQGIDAKDSCYVATTTNLASLAGLLTIDGSLLTAGDRVLVKNQTSPSQNGIYIAASGGWSRATDFDTWAEFPGSYVFVVTGTAGGGTGWVFSGSNSGTVGSSSITFTQFSAAGSIIAGNGLVGTSTFDVNVDNVGIEIVTDTLQLKDGGITSAKYGPASINLSTGAGKVISVLPVANGGTGGATAQSARVNLAVPGLARVSSPALTAGVWADVAHNIGAEPLGVTFKGTADLTAVDLDWRMKFADTTQTIQIKTDIPGGRAAAYYQIAVWA